MTLPFLNCPEVCEQTDLLTTFPKLYTSLYVADMNTLNKFIVVYKHLPIREPDKEIIKRMCIDAAEGVKLQRGREYGLSKSDARVNQLDKVAPIRITNKQLRYRKGFVKT